MLGSREGRNTDIITQSMIVALQLDHLKHLKPDKNIEEGSICCSVSSGQNHVILSLVKLHKERAPHILR